MTSPPSNEETLQQTEASLLSIVAEFPENYSFPPFVRDFINIHIEFHRSMNEHARLVDLLDSFHENQNTPPFLEDKGFPLIDETDFLLGNKQNLEPIYTNLTSWTTRQMWIRKLESYKETTPDTASTCSICYKKDEGDFVLMLECIHMFCAPCIKYWFGPNSSTSKYSCPHCRTEITECIKVARVDDIMAKLKAEAALLIR